jgi:prolyl 4-hydroxylase
MHSSRKPFSNGNRYTKGNYFREHFDWFDPEKDKTLSESGNRATSFFVYLVADCEGGTTVFPKVPRPEAPEWCGLLKCQNENGTEVEWLEVQATVGTAIFWHNFDSAGELDDMVLHAGADVWSGKKVGLNIWTREKKYRV